MFKNFFKCYYILGFMVPFTAVAGTAYEDLIAAIDKRSEKKVSRLLEQSTLKKQEYQNLVKYADTKLARIMTDSLYSWKTVLGSFAAFGAFAYGMHKTDGDGHSSEPLDRGLKYGGLATLAILSVHLWQRAGTLREQHKHAMAIKKIIEEAFAREAGAEHLL